MIFFFVTSIGAALLEASTWFGCVALLLELKVNVCGQKVFALFGRFLELGVKDLVEQTRAKMKHVSPVLRTHWLAKLGAPMNEMSLCVLTYLWMVCSV